MKCFNCEKEMQDGLEQCPHCGCHYPEKEKPKKRTPAEIEKTPEAKQIKVLIDTAVAKGYVTDQEREVILRTAHTNGLDVEVTQMMLDAALNKAKSQIAERTRREAEENARREDEEKAKTEPECLEEPEESLHHETEIIAEAPARFCRNCGNPLRAGAMFCHKCGTKI